MLRRVLTYQLILAVAVGPLLCCCSAGKGLAGSPSAKTPSPSPAPVERVAHPCCSHKHGPANPNPDQKPAPTKPGHPTEKCPCKDGDGKPPATQAELTQSDLSTFLRSLTFDPFVSFVCPPVSFEILSEATRLGGGSRPGHELSVADELLYAHHNLRC